MKPVKVSSRRLIDLLRAIADLVEAGDSFSGSVTYDATGDEDFDISASYRYGNLNGQGFVRLIGEKP